MPDKLVFLPVIQNCDNGNKCGQRRKKRGPSLLPHHFHHDKHYVAGQFSRAARLPGSPAHMGAQSGKKFFFIARSRHFRKCRTDRRQRVRVTAGDANLCPLPRKPCGGAVLLLKQLAIAGLDSGEMLFKTAEIIFYARTREAGKNVIDTEEDMALSQIRQERSHIAAALLNLYMLLFRNVEDPYVRSRAARHAAGNFLTYKKPGVLKKSFGALDRIVIGQCEKIETAPPQLFVDLLWRAIAFTAKKGNDGGGAGARVV